MNFSDVGESLRNLMAVLPAPRVWILIDEWSSMPRNVQPIFADMIKRLLLPVQGITVKVGAIEQRSQFLERDARGNHIGFELGADIAAGIDLDDFMVFGRNADEARNFMAALLYKHVKAELAAEGIVEGIPVNTGEFVRQAFTQENAFEELVRAAEGVPRDAINVVIMSAATAGDARIGIPDIQGAARKWYQTDKESATAADRDAEAFLYWTIDEVIGKRRARAFLVPQNVAESNPLVGELYDARVLHVLKRGVSDKDRAGVRFDAYQLDYGCYVELVTTRATLGVLPGEEDVPIIVEFPAVL